MTTLDLRGRDLVIIPDDALLRLPMPELLRALFGAHLPAQVHERMGRDKRGLFLRALPMHFSAVKQALRQQGTAFRVAFEEQPALPFETKLAIEPRPYQEEALTQWLAEGSRGVVVLPTGAGRSEEHT